MIISFIAVIKTLTQTSLSHQQSTEIGVGVSPKFDERPRSANGRKVIAH
jgi:hypothetical protein